MTVSPYLTALLSRIRNAGAAGHALGQGEIAGALMLGIHRLVRVDASRATITREGEQALRWAA